MTEDTTVAGVTENSLLLVFTLLSVSVLLFGGEAAVDLTAMLGVIMFSLLIAADEEDSVIDVIVSFFTDGEYPASILALLIAVGVLENSLLSMFNLYPASFPVLSVGLGVLALILFISHWIRRE